MANADFSKQEQTPGGFTSGSYRAKKTEQSKPLTPAQQKLAKVEKALPGAMQKQAVALVVLVLVMALSVFGIGGAKLRMGYQKAAGSFTHGVAEDVKSGGQYTMRAQLEIRAASAKNVLLAASGFDGVDQNVLDAAQVAVEGMEAALEADHGGTPEALYDADVALESAINLLHAEVQANAPDAMQTGSEQTAFSKFASAGTTIHHLSYNEAAQAYNKKAGGFPANVIGKLWGCGKVDLFA